MGTTPSFSCAGTMGSICVKAASYSATSTTWPLPVKPRAWMAAMAPNAAYTDDR